MKNLIYPVLLSVCLLLVITGCEKDDNSQKKDVSELTPDENKRKLEQIGTQLMLKINPVEQKKLLETLDAFVALGGKEQISTTGTAYLLHQYSPETGWSYTENHDCIEYRYPVGKKKGVLKASYSGERCTIYDREIPKEMHSTILLDSKKMCVADLVFEQEAMGDIKATGTINANQCVFHLLGRLSEHADATFSLWLQNGKEKLLAVSATANISDSYVLNAGKVQLNILDEVIVDFSAENLSEMREELNAIEEDAATQDYYQAVADIYNQYVKGSFHYTESDYVVASIGFQPYHNNDGRWDIESIFCFTKDQSKYSLDSYLGINLAFWLMKICGGSVYSL